MRPDEHKKKKSAQYQRKHGGSAASLKVGKNEKTSTKSGKPVLSGKTSQTTRSVQHKPQKEDKNVDLSTSDTDSEVEGAIPSERKTYQRREIASNWAKYDIPPVEADDNANANKGQDFNKLLQAAGGAISHFRFKEEESWEEERGSDPVSASAILSLDCNQLATSLDCLPLYTQLHLDTNIFTSAQIAVMDKTADQHRISVGLPSLHQNGDTDSMQLSSISTDSPKSLTVAPVSVSQDIKNSETDGSGIKAMTEISAGSKEQKRQLTHALQLTDADLDDLLKSDESADEFGEKDHASAVSGEHSKNTGNITEEDLDNILSKDTPQVFDQVLYSSQKVKDAKTAAESLELEDWLDSVLDN